MHFIRYKLYALFVWLCHTQMPSQASIRSSTLTLAFPLGNANKDLPSSLVLSASVLQVWYGILMSTAYSASMFRSGVGIFATMLNIYQTGKVSATFPVTVRLRCAAAFFTSAGVIAGGGRLMPVTGKHGLHLLIRQQRHHDAAQAYCERKLCGSLSCICVLPVTCSSFAYSLSLRAFTS